MKYFPTMGAGTSARGPVEHLVAPPEISSARRLTLHSV
jgi:hypothetical protein